MILSSVAGSTQNLTKEQIETQTQLVLKVLHSAQNEMRALLLHLRPVELDGKSLAEGLSALTDELKRKFQQILQLNWLTLKRRVMLRTIYFEWLKRFYRILCVIRKPSTLKFL